MKPLLKRLLFLALAAGAVAAFADTTTSRFGLTKPDVGSTNWGPKLNTNSDTIDNAAGIALNNTFTQTNTFTGPVTISTLTVQGTQTNTGLMSVSSVTASQTVTAGKLSVTGATTVTTVTASGYISGSSVTTTNLSYTTGVGSTLTLSTITATSSSISSETISGTISITGLTTLGTDAYSTVFQDYSGSSTVTGWSSFTTKQIYYKRLGKVVVVWFSIDGTSNATTISFTLPFTQQTSVDTFSFVRARDNNVDQTNPGICEFDKNTSLVSCFKDCAFSTWTNSNRKIVNGTFVYQTN